jgi:hypothetical protein
VVEKVFAPRQRRKAGERRSSGGGRYLAALRAIQVVSPSCMFGFETTGTPCRSCPRKVQPGRVDVLKDVERHWPKAGRPNERQCDETAGN